MSTRDQWYLWVESAHPNTLGTARSTHSPEIIPAESTTSRPEPASLLLSRRHYSAMQRLVDLIKKTILVSVTMMRRHGTQR